MNNYSIAQEASETAANSFGSAMREQEKYSESLQARINRLSNAFTSLAVSAGDALISDTLIVATEEFGDFLKTTGDVIDVIGVLPIVMGTAGVATVLLSKNVRGMSTALLTGNVSLAGTATSLFGLEAGMSRAAIATAVFKTALRGLMVATGVGAILTVLGFAIEKLANHFAEAKQKQQEYEQIQNTTVESLTANKQATDELLKKYQELTEAKNSGNFNSDKEKEYLQVSQQLAGLLPSLVDHYDSQGNAVLKVGEALEQEIEYTKELVRQKKELQQLEAKDNIQSALKSADKIDNQINKKNKILDHTVGISGVNYSAKEKKQIEIEITELKRQYNEQQMKLREELQKTVDSYFTDITIDTSITAKVNSVISSLDVSGASAEELNTFATNIADAMKKMQNAVSNNDENAYKIAKADLDDLLTSYKVAEGGSRNLELSFQQVQDSINGVSDAAKGQKVIWDENGEVVGEVSGEYEDLSSRLQDAKGDFEAIRNIILETAKAGDYQAAITASMTDAYSALSDEISPLNDLLEKTAEGKSISSNEAMQLIAKEKDLASAISVENGQIKINREAVLKLRDAKVASYKQMIDAQKREVQAQSEGLKTKLKNFGVEVKGILTVAQANEALAKAEEERARKMAGLNTDQTGAMYGSTVVQNQYEGITSGINDIKSAYEALDQMSAIASAGLKEVGTSAESSSDKTSKANEKSTYTTDKYKQKTEELALALAKVDKIKSEYPQRSKKYQDAIKQEIKLKQQQLKLMNDEVSSLNKQIKSGNIKQTGKVASSSSTSSSSNYASGGSTEATVWNFFKSKGFSDSATAGIMGNLRQESGFSTTAVNKSSGATGIAQWLGGRLSGLKNFAGSQGTSYTNLNTQLEWLWKELNGADVTTKSIINKNGGMNAFMNMGVNDAALLFEKAFERSGGDALANRQKYANDIYVKYAGTTPTVSANVSSDVADKAQAIDQAKSEVLGLQEEALQIQQQIQQLNMDLIESVVAGIDHQKEELQDDLAQIDLVQSYETESSNKWTDAQLKKEKLLRQQLGYEQEAMKYLKEQIKNNKALTEAQKAQLSDDLLQRTQDMISLEQQMLDQRKQMADSIIDTYKQAAESIKDAQLDTIDKLIDEINKSDDAEKHAKQLADAQKDRQALQDEYNKMLLDDSDYGKKRQKELKEQLEQADESLSDMQSDYAKEQRINNLNEQKDSIQKEFDNLVNDERKFAQMRSDIINGNASQIQKDLDKYFTNIKANANVMGQSISNNLIDLINQANRYLNGKDYKPIKIASAREGGITPSWGSGGKEMIVHEDEMISTKHDTKNLLTAMDEAKSLVNSFKTMEIGKSLASAAKSVLTNFKVQQVQSLSPSVSTAGDTNNYFTMKVDKVIGDQKGVENAFDLLQKKMKAKGGNL
ncbi:phage tail tip lysozyme [Niallia alba]|uniref:phage tail tip lysozyme n=1 Tax=Niallia alba TaxID=2729105 RepID=UPI002E1AA03B|nr:phage tail tip lysozyme [Niallia alba]